jgi:hypothetical protein
MKTTKTFENASLVSVMNGSVIVKSVAGTEHTFTNASVVSVNNGTIIIESEWKPKRGELVKVLHTGINCYVVFNMIDPYVSHLHTFGNKEIRNSFYKLDDDIWLIDKNTELHPVTPEEQQAFDDFCKSKGKIWNKEKLQWEEYRWKPMEDTTYFNILIKGGTTQIIQYTWRNDIIDRNLYKLGNCFKTKEEAEAKLKRIKEILAQ